MNLLFMTFSKTKRSVKKQRRKIDDTQYSLIKSGSMIVHIV